MKSLRLKKYALAGLLPLFGGVILTAPAMLSAAENPVATDQQKNRFRSTEIFGHAELAAAVKSASPAVQTMSPTSFVVLGEVNCPGAFEIAGPVNLPAALMAAGGPSESGTFRCIEVYKDKELLGEFDLYDFFLPDRVSNDLIFNGGEEVVVPPAGPMVKIGGQVHRPGVFEIRPAEMNLARVVGLSGGFSSNESCRVEILRIMNGYRRVFMAMELGSGEKIPEMKLQDGDEVNVAVCSQNKSRISIEGHVTPGMVVYREGIRLSDIMRNGVRLREKAFLGYAEILRAGQRDGGYEVLSFSPDSLLNGDLEADISLRPGDRVIFFSEKMLSESPMTFVEGLVAKPGRQTFVSGMTIKKMIELAGGLKSDGDQNLVAELARREIASGRLNYSRVEINLAAALSDDPRHNLILKPFDSLRIYQKN